jgi:hypothetical protein
VRLYPSWQPAGNLTQAEWRLPPDTLSRGATHHATLDLQKQIGQHLKTAVSSVWLRRRSQTCDTNACRRLHSLTHRLFDEGADHVVCVCRIAHSVCASQEHLQAAWGF